MEFWGGNLQKWENAECAWSGQNLKYSAIGLFFRMLISKISWTVRNTLVKDKMQHMIKKSIHFNSVSNTLVMWVIRLVVNDIVNIKFEECYLSSTILLFLLKNYHW